MVAPSQQHFAPRMTTQTAQRVKVKENGTCAMVPQSSVLSVAVAVANDSEGEGRRGRQVRGLLLSPNHQISADVSKCFK